MAFKKKPEGIKWLETTEEHEEVRPHEELMTEYLNKIQNSKIKNKELKQILSDIIGFIQERISLRGESFLTEEIYLMQS